MATAATTLSPIILPALPYPENALEPVISAKTVGFHYGKHHKTYVETANKLIAARTVQSRCTRRLLKLGDGPMGA